MERGGKNFWDHVLSLRFHLLWAFGILVALGVLVFVYLSDWIIFKTFEPLKGEPLVFLSPLAPFLFKLQVALYGAAAFAWPFWLILFLHFVFPALSRRQKRLAGGFCVASLVLGAVSLWVSLEYMIPYSLDFLLGFKVPGTEIMLAANDYFDFFILQAGLAFLLFQMPLAIAILAALNIIDPRALAAKRRLLYVGLLIGLAILTPTTDILTLLIVFIPSIFLLEGGLWTARLISRENRTIMAP